MVKKLRVYFFLYLILTASSGVILISPALAQTTFFSENVGTPSGTIAVGSYTGWQNASPITFQGNADVRNTQPSTGYAGASGGGNVFMGVSAGEGVFEISNISTLGYNAIFLQFGAFKSTTASDMTELKVEYSVDGVNYLPLTFPAQPTGTGTAIWRLISIQETIPAVPGLRLRWNNTSTNTSFRIDDIKLSGVLSSNTVDIAGISSAAFTLPNCTATASFQVSYSATGLFGPTNKYYVQLSDANGDFSNATVIGEISSAANAGSINATLPSGIVSGSNYRVRIFSTSPSVISSISAPISITQNGVCVSSANHYFRTKQSGSWSQPTTWESSPDNVNWINATLAPTAAANNIVIRSGHQVNINSNITADQLIIEAGATLLHSNGYTFSLQDGAEEADMTIWGTYVLYGSVPSGAGKYVVENGGTIRADGNSGGTADDIAWHTNSRVLFKTGSVFDWNNSLAFNTSDITFFPDNNEKPTFRISKPMGTLGANSVTRINGLFEVNGSITFDGTGIKIFRDGIIGTGTLTQSTNTGAFQITAKPNVHNAQLGMATIVLNGAGLEITNGAVVDMVSNTMVNGAGTMTVQSGGRLNCANFVLLGSAVFQLSDGAKLGIGSPDGISSSGATGNIQTAGRIYHSNADYYYNGTTNQVTGGFQTTPVPNRVNTLNIANTGNTVTLSPGNNNMQVAGLYLNQGFFCAGLNQTLRIENNGAVFGNGGNNPNLPEAGNIEFMGAGKTAGFNMGNPFLYSVIINGPVDFNDVNNSHSATIGHRLQLNVNSSVVDAPYYAPGASLVYATGGTYARNVEWGNASGLQGYPHHVVVQGNTILELNTNPISEPALEIGGNLIIGNETGRGEVYMNNNMAKSLIVKGNVVIGNTSPAANNSRLRLSDVIGGDLEVHGSITRYANGTFDDVGRATFLRGGTNATLNTPDVPVTPGNSTLDFSYLFIAKDNANVQVTLNCPVGIQQLINFDKGIVVSSSTNPLIIKNNATSVGASTQSFVSGVVRKIGNQSFTFPVGKIVGSELHYRPVSISGLTASATYTAEFFRANATQWPITSDGLVRVSSCEYWELQREGSGNANVTLVWTPQSPCNVPQAYVTAPASTVVAYNNGTSWSAHGGTGTGDPSPGSGSVTWNGVSSFNRFTIGTTSYAQNPLPLQLNSFLGRERGKDILLNWVVSDNSIYHHYELEHSTDGRHFTRIAKIEPVMVIFEAAYSSVHRQPVSGWNYYRLRGITKDGAQRYSHIIKVWFGSKNEIIQFYPNPVIEKIMVSLQNPGSVRAIQIVNINGQVLLSILPRESITVIQATNLKAGTYYLRMIHADGVWVKPFVKL